MIRETIYSEKGIFAGWPANHGTYQWDNEILVGFIRGEYHPTSQMHHVWGNLEFVQTRSLDYGKNWQLEETSIYEYFDENNMKAPPYFVITQEDTIIRVRGNYDHGGDKIAREGGFWLSENRGKNWEGPYWFEGINFPDHKQNTSRTCVIEDYVFLSQADIYAWGSDEIFVAEKDMDRFSLLSTDMAVSDENRAVMPSVTIYNNEYYMACRRLGNRNCWVDIYKSKDLINWKLFLGGFDTGGSNGNPPALSKFNDKLVCCYGNRSDKKLYASIIEGKELKDRVTLAEFFNSDFGYPTLFYDEDGLCCTFYNDSGDRSAIEFVRFSP